MKSFTQLLLLLAFPFALSAQSEAKIEVEVSKNVLKTAEWAGFKYMEKVDLAQRGDYHAMRDLLEFSGTVDGVEAIQHAVTCIELIPMVSDETAGSVICVLKPKLKTILLDRFQLAQTRTKKEALRKPMQEWAPLTWSALNGKMVIACMNPGGKKEPEGEKAATNNTPEKQ